MEEESTKRTTPRPEEKEHLLSGTILLVEDSVDDVELTLRALRRNGFKNRVVTVRDGVQALDYLKRQGEYVSLQEPHPALILLDLKLPKVDGLEVLEQIKADPDLQSLPVVMLTSSNREVDVKRAYGLGVNSYICKPTDFGEFLEVVSRLGRYWFETVELPPDSHPRANKSSNRQHMKPEW